MSWAQRSFLQPSKLLTIALRHYYLFRCIPSKVRLRCLNHEGPTDNFHSRSLERHLASLCSSLVFFPLCGIHDGPLSSERIGLFDSQQDSEDFRSEREQHDETKGSHHDYRTERYLKPARVDRFRTSISLIRACLNVLVGSRAWACGSRLVVDRNRSRRRLSSSKPTLTMYILRASNGICGPFAPCLPHAL